jgi:hypothetical protein
LSTEADSQGTVWITSSDGGGTLWHAGNQVKTDATSPDFPSFAYSQVPVGRVQAREPEYGILAYKDRGSGRVFVRRVEGDRLGKEQVILAEPTVGGISVAVSDDDVVGRVDLLRDGRLVPAIYSSNDGGRTFEGPTEIDLSAATRGDFVARPGFQRPIVDKGGSFHLPIGMESSSEALLLNFVVASDLLVEAIRVPGQLRKGDLEVFPSTLGSGNTFGNGVSDGHGLIMVLNTEEGLLFSSNSSAGGGHFPEAKLLNHEVPLVAEFSASECYSSGHKPNVVSMIEFANRIAIRSGLSRVSAGWGHTLDSGQPEDVTDERQGMARRALRGPSRLHAIGCLPDARFAPRGRRRGAGRLAARDPRRCRRNPQPRRMADNDRGADQPEHAPDAEQAARGLL